MKKIVSKKQKYNLVPFDVIKAASEGDIVAIQTILKHYERYIVKLSTRIIRDEFGNSYLCVDEVMKQQLEAHLVVKILSFRLVPWNRNSKV